MAKQRGSFLQEPVCYDAVVCVAMHHNSIATKAIESLCVFSQVKNIYVITRMENFSVFQKLQDAGFPIILLDERVLIEGVNLLTLQNYFRQRSASLSRASWYFQQFLKMAICYRKDISDYYLIWDGDTVVLQPINFFDLEGRILVNTKPKQHMPMIQVMHTLLGLQQKLGFSFISEHFMVNKQYMKDLIKRIELRFPQKESWVFAILELIDDENLGRSGFSEYETYGNFLHSTYPESYVYRPLKSLRSGSKRYGQFPNQFDLHVLSKEYAYVSFESWQYPKRKKHWIRKAQALYMYLQDYVLDKVSPHLRGKPDLFRLLKG